MRHSLRQVSRDATQEKSVLAQARVLVVEDKRVNQKDVTKRVLPVSVCEPKSEARYLCRA